MRSRPPDSGPELALRIDRVLVVAMLVGGLISYFALPDRFPIHFDLAGNPDVYAARGAGG